MIKVWAIIGIAVSSVLTIPLFFIRLGRSPQMLEQCRDTVVSLPAKCPTDTRTTAVWHTNGGDDYMLCVCAGGGTVVKW